MEFKILDDINEDIIAIRKEAFVEGRGVPPEIEFDGKDSDMLHFCLYDGDRLISYLRAEILGDILHIGRVSVSADMRKNGYGRKLMDFLVGYAKEKGFKKVELSAVDTAVGFYERIGFLAEGDYYLETGVPHIYMYREII